MWNNKNNNQYGFNSNTGPMQPAPYNQRPNIHPSQPPVTKPGIKPRHLPNDFGLEGQYNPNNTWWGRMTPWNDQWLSSQDWGRGLGMGLGGHALGGIGMMLGGPLGWGLGTGLGAGIGGHLGSGNTAGQFWDKTIGKHGLGGLLGRTMGL